VPMSTSYTSQAGGVWAPGAAVAKRPHLHGARESTERQLALATGAWLVRRHVRRARNVSCCGKTAGESLTRLPSAAGNEPIHLVLEQKEERVHFENGRISP
jgi:hypothetical protein